MTVTESMEKGLQQASILDEKQKRNERSRIMKTFKGQYDFEWKHERISWRSAKCRIFLDVGEGDLFEKTSEWTLRKLTADDFLMATADKPD